MSTISKKALRWLDSQLESYFNPFVDPAHIDEMGIKAMSELAFLVIHVLRLEFDAPPAIHHQITKFTNYLFSVVENNEFASVILDNQLIVMAYSLFEELYDLVGRGSADAKQLIQRMFETRYLFAVERPPYRKMDLCYSLNRVGIKHDLPSLMQLYRSTLLANNPQLACLDSSDVYSITHTIFYLTDMGQRLPDETDMSHQEIEEVRQIVRTLMGMYLRTSDLDILGELLMCQAQLRDKPTFTTAVAWERLSRGQDESGYVPGPTFSTRKLNNLPSEEREAYIFKQSYHTTLVAAMAGLFWMSLISKSNAIAHAHA